MLHEKIPTGLNTVGRFIRLVHKRTLALCILGTDTQIEATIKLVCQRPSALYASPLSMQTFFIGKMQSTRKLDIYVTKAKPCAP